MSGIFEWILSQKWAITPDALEAVLAIAQRTDITEEAISKAIHSTKWERYTKIEGDPSLMALEGARYPRLEGTRNVSQIKNVAVLPVVGPIIPRSGFFSSMSGMTSVDTIAKDFNIALEADEIDTIILNLDSPGGEITGIAELSRMIFAAKSKKKILAYVYGMAASAGYWIASSASEIVTSPTGEVGSIGVIAAITSTKEADEKKGIKRTEIVSSQSPNKRPDIESNSGRAQIQLIVDKLADVFINDVARNRGVEEGVVLEKFGQGGLFVGSSSIEFGLTDRLGSLESLIQENRKQTQSPYYIGGSMNLEEFQTQHSALFEQVKKMGAGEATAEMEAKVSEARAEGAKAENERIKDIESLDVPGAEAIVTENKFNSTETKASIAAKVLDAQKQGRLELAKKVNADGKKLANSLTCVDSPDSASADSSERQAIVKAGKETLNQNRK